MSLGTAITLAELERDPDPILARLRHEEPVAWVPSLSMWLVTRWDDVAYMEEHPELFTAATDPSFLARALGPNMLTMDPPEHTRVRDCFLPSFVAGGRSGTFVAGELAALASGLLEDVAGPFELMSTYAQPLSAGSLATVLGLDGEGFDQMWSWCEGLCADIANFENDPALTELGDRARDELGVAIGGHLSGLADDDVSALASFVRAGAAPDEVINNVRLMISGGINEPRGEVGLVTWVLLTEPHLRDAVDAEASNWRRLIEEVFRRYSPVGTITRQATQDLVLAGVAIDQGQLIAGVLRSINLDESQWTRPLEIDLSRREGLHAAFAFGAHRCLGEWLGRQVVRIRCQTLFSRFPALALDPDHDVELSGFEFRGPHTLHLCA